MRLSALERLLTGILLSGLIIACTQRKSGRMIIFFGDSITQQGAGPGGYIELLNGAFDRHGLADSVALVGAGIPGNKVGDLRDRLAADVLNERPDIVVIYVGINDVWHKRTYGAGTDAGTFRGIYQDMIDKLRERGIRTVLCTLSVIGERTDHTNPQDEDLDRYSDIVRELARTNHLPIVDLRKAFLDHNAKNNPTNQELGILTTDGVHLNSAGNRLVAEAMWAVLKDV